MPTFGFVIDNRKCIGCHACTVACKSEHQVPIGVDRTWVKYIEKGTFPNNRRYFSVMRCNHCENAPCVTICPVTALYSRADGVVDFNNERCIGCKSCIQACPYDALYIDPDTSTAAKCNFCTHRLEIGLQPSCVAVCPEQAIIAGDMDDRNSEISRLLDRQPVQVRKPEKGTRPKLFYIEADEASLVPTRTNNDGRGIFSRGAFVGTDGAVAITASENGQEPAAPATNGLAGAVGSGSQRLALPVVADELAPRRVYDVRPRKPAWGWMVYGYTWTKSIAAGAFLAVFAARFMTEPGKAARLENVMGPVALLFLVLTAFLLVIDLKKPGRFLYVLLRPQWGSWLVRGAYCLTGYGMIVTLWTIAQFFDATVVKGILLWPGALLAVVTAVYTAFLFAQAKGRDFWQNPLLAVHLLAHALLAGGALWLVAETGTDVPLAPRAFTAGMLIFSLVSIFAELLTTPPTTDAHLAMEWIIGRPMGRWFWGMGIGVGHVLPLILLAIAFPAAAYLAVLLAMAGMLAIERLWVLAPQQVPLS